jgi:serralysin
MALYVGNSGYNNFVGTTSNDTFEMLVHYGLPDIVDGGKGTDTLSYATADRGVNVTMANGTQLGSTTANFVTLSFLNPLTGQYFQEVETSTVTRFKGIENVIGSRFDDTIRGNSANNKLEGGDGHDEIRGGGGNDIVVGGRGEDSLYGDDGTGPGGADTFVFKSFKDSNEIPQLSAGYTGNVFTDLGRDTIYDFEAGKDKIDLSAIDANSKNSGNQAFNFLGTFPDEGPANLFTGKPGELFAIEFDSPNQLNAEFVTLIMGDIDGDRESDFELQVCTPFSIVSLTANDFLL